MFNSSCLQGWYRIDAIVVWSYADSCSIHTDAINKQTQEDFFNKIFTSHFIARVRKGYSRFACERELETEQNWNILTPTLMAINVVSFSFSWCSTRGPGVHSAGCWLSLLHLISNFSGPQTPSGFSRAPSAGRGFLYHISSITLSQLYCNSTELSWLLSWLGYIIVQRPLDRPLDLWNRMFNRHQAEITVMQFRGHSLPVRQSMRVSWDFFTSSHFISQFPPTRFPLITAIRMCYFLPVHHLGMAFLAGSKAKIQHNLLDKSNKYRRGSLGSHWKWNRWLKFES